MGVGALFKAGLVEWMSAQTYQAASGGGAQHMRELLTQFGTFNAEVSALLDDPKSAILEIDRKVAGKQRSLSARPRRRTSACRSAAALIPWIDKDLGDGISREEWKGGAETNKILGQGAGFGAPAVPVDGFCVRVGAMRCHSQALTFKLKKDVPLADIEAHDRRRQRMGEGGAEHARGHDARADAGGRDRHDDDPGRPPAQDGDGAAVPGRVHRSATSCCGARPSRCAACCASCSKPERVAWRGAAARCHPATSALSMTSCQSCDRISANA